MISVDPSSQRLKPRLGQGRTGRVTSLSSSPAAQAAHLVRFAIVGIAALVVYWVVTNAATALGGLHLMAASILGFIGAGLTSYFGHSRFSFRVAPDHRSHGPKFAVVALLGLLFNVAMVWACSAVDASAPIITAVVGISLPAFNYMLNRLWVFGSEVGRTQQPEDAS